MISATELTQKLIQIDSITPNDKGCQIIIADLLQSAGFTIQHKRFKDVDNLFAYHENPSNITQSPSLMFVGHTDVVPTGDEYLWTHPPFSAIIDSGQLYGRGAADMKSAVAAFTLAMIGYVNNQPNHSGKIALMLTSDEEGVAHNGIKRMMPFVANDHQFDYCVVGEPSSNKKLGDTVRIGRRGSLHVRITIHGKQGHVAYPENADNPVFLASQFIHDLSQYQWDQGNADFPPTSFQISHVDTTTNTANIIPADLMIQANFRYSPESSEESLNNQLIKLLKQHNLNFSLEWNLSGLPFHSKNEVLKNAIKSSITEITQVNTVFNTAGGTSDGRFIAPHGVDVVELGVINKTIHQIDEKVNVVDIEKLQNIYYQLISKLLK